MLVKCFSILGVFLFTASADSNLLKITMMHYCREFLFFSILPERRGLLHMNYKKEIDLQSLSEVGD